MQRERLKADPLTDLRPVRVRTARTFLDGFAKIRQGQAGLDLPIFAAMSPTDKVCCQALACAATISSLTIMAVQKHPC